MIENREKGATRTTTSLTRRRCGVAIAVLHLVVGPFLVAVSAYSGISTFGWDGQDPGAGPPDLLFLSLPLLVGALGVLLVRGAIDHRRLWLLGVGATLAVAGLHVLVATMMISSQFQPTGPPIAGGDVAWAATTYASLSVVYVLLVTVPLGRSDH